MDGIHFRGVAAAPGDPRAFIPTLRLFSRRLTERRVYGIYKSRDNSDHVNEIRKQHIKTLAIVVRGRDRRISTFRDVNRGMQACEFASHNFIKRTVTVTFLSFVVVLWETIS